MIVHVVKDYLVFYVILKRSKLFIFLNGDIHNYPDAFVTGIFLYLNDILEKHKYANMYVLKHG